MNIQDTLSLLTLIVGTTVAVSSFLYFLVSLTIRVTNFLRELRGDITDLHKGQIEMRADMRDHNQLVCRLKRQVNYLTKIIKEQFPDYFKREEDKDEADN